MARRVYSLVEQSTSTSSHLDVSTMSSQPLQPRASATSQFTSTTTPGTTPYLFLESSRPLVLPSSYPLHPWRRLRPLPPYHHGERNMWQERRTPGLCHHPPTSTDATAKTFKGHYCAPFDYDTTLIPSTLFGTVQNSTANSNAADDVGQVVGGFAVLPSQTRRRP